ncbi:MAG: S24/S26 family peptidase [Thermoguttaceae bacterium]
MSIQLRRGLVAGLVLGCWLSMVAVVAASGEREGQTSGQAPRTEPTFKPGDILTVAAERANLMRGAEVVAVVPGGERLVVVEVRDQWIGTYVSENGERKAGWLRTSDFVPVTDVAAKPQAGQACLCAMQTATAAPPAPAAAYPVGAAYSVGSGPMQGYYQGYFSSYYSHEPDPDIHAWQPWMH